MKSDQVREILRTAEEINRELKTHPNQLAATLAELARLEKSLRRLAEINCERDLTPTEARRETRLENRVKAILPGIRVKFNGDPRGPCIKVFFKNGAYNSMDGESWRIMYA